MQSENTSQSWESAMQQPVAAQPKASKSSMQEMDSLLAAEKVCTIKSKQANRTILLALLIQMLCDCSVASQPTIVADPEQLLNGDLTG